ncbi:MAG TPA: hypothetical protein VFN92_11365 [Solirubrobacterales bacterium]|nr:hypothetical protein [Solirubrobacterales bacterium]
MKYLKMLGLAALAATALAAWLGPATASATTVEVGGVAQNKAVAFTISLKSGTSTAFKDTTNNVVDTCTSSEINGNTVAPFTNVNAVNASVIEFYFANCTSGKTQVLKGGKLSFEWTVNTNGTARSSEAEITVWDNIFGASAVCKTGTTIIGTVTGVAAGQATLHVNTVLACGLLGTVKWEGTYAFTSPAGFGLRQ